MKNINIKAIRTDGGTQMRANFSEETVAEYVGVLNGGTDLPPVVLFSDGTDHWMADGFHRLAAYVAAGRASIPSDVRQGGQRDAFLYALGANDDHGMRRTNDDKRKAVAAALADEELAKQSDREIAKVCKVSNTFVSNIRNPKPAPNPPAPPPPVAPPKAPKAPTGAGTMTGEAAPGVNVDSQPAAQPPDVAPPSPAEPSPDEDRADDTLDDVIDDLQTDIARLEKEIEERDETIKAMAVDDAKAEVLKWKHIANIANTRQGELMDANKDKADRIAWLERQLDRIGKAVGEEDRSCIAATVEQFVRSMKVAS